MAVSRELLAAGLWPERYRRNAGTLGLEGQRRLLVSSVLIVGAGGLGGLVMELLARSGVGRLRVVDGDCFEEHNLNRQLLCTQSVLGRNKAQVAAQRLRDVNDEVEVEAVPAWLSESNAAALLQGMDVAVDALDDLHLRLLLSRQAQRAGVPLVHGAIAGWSGRVTTVLPGGPGLEVLYPPARTPRRGVEQQLGNPATTPALAATLQAQEVLAILSGKGARLAGRLQHFDLETGEFALFSWGGQA